MSRAALTVILILVLGDPAAAVGGLNPHVNPSEVLVGCIACHRGHGVPRSPMLPTYQKEVCLSCHDSRARFDYQVIRGIVAGTASPAFLAAVLSKPSVHPLSAYALSRNESQAVTCCSCHSPHRSMPEPESVGAFPGRRKLSPRDPNRFEFQLCESCHGSAGVVTRSLTDISRLFNANSRSYHPVEAPVTEPSPSIIGALSGAEINCTDCHGNNNPSGARGPHGSDVGYILRFNYTMVDGAAESVSTYALCYMCHDRKLLLEVPPFPEHGTHIVDERASCATCHNPHGSVENRALIRFGEETFLGAGAVAPSGSGRLGFESAGPGSGACYLTCHGRDHDPESYGGQPVIDSGTRMRHQRRSR
ncbi:MAG: hypothetical protein GY856_21110 [bacterium]|nr:hypothetical protein [bacterium]